MELSIGMFRDLFGQIYSLPLIQIFAASCVATNHIFDTTPILGLEFPPETDDASLGIIVEHCPRLRYADLTDSWVGDAGVEKMMSQCPLITRLNLRFVQVSKKIYDKYKNIIIGNTKIKWGTDYADRPHIKYTESDVLPDSSGIIISVGWSCDEKRKQCRKFSMVGSGDLHGPNITWCVSDRTVIFECTYDHGCSVGDYVYKHSSPPHHIYATVHPIYQIPGKYEYPYKARIVNKYPSGLTREMYTVKHTCAGCTFVGEYQKWYDSGQLMIQCNYDENGQLDGLYFEWTSSGELESSEQYSHGIKLDEN